MTREQAEANLKVATDKVETLESLAEIHRLTRPAAGHGSEQEARELKAKLEKATIEQQEAQRQVDLLTIAPKVDS